MVEKEREGSKEREKGGEVEKEREMGKERRFEVRVGGEGVGTVRRYG